MKVNYCSSCGSQSISFDLPENDQMERLVCGSCGTIHYENPKMVVGCVVVENEKILLAKRAIEPCINLWNLPAGYLENGETVEQGAAREVLEETGVKVTVKQLICIYNLPHARQVYLLFLAEPVAGKPTATHESLEAAYFAPEDIPWNTIAFTSTSFTLTHFLKHKNKEEIPVAMSSFAK